MNNGRVTVVLDAQAGSCGKGKVAGYIALKDNVAVAINNFMSNAGHTFVTDSGEKIMTQHLPTSMVNPNTILCIGPGAAITPDILIKEILKYEDMIGDRMIYIHPRAMIILDEHAEKEKEIMKSGSTFKGCGVAQAQKVMRVPGTMLAGEWYENIMDESIYNTDEHHALSKIDITDTSIIVNEAYDKGLHILVEGSQGCDLDINYGLPYPHTTSRQCHAGQLLADCGLSPRTVTDIIQIMRPYPIRISNTTNLKDDNGNEIVISSGDYDGSEEITWDIVKERCGAPADVEFGEMTTVTKKMRRVFEMNWDRLRYVTTLNRPTQIALNFAQYIDWDAIGKTEYEELSDMMREFIYKIEEETGVPVTLIGTGAENNKIIDMRGELK